MGLMLSTALIVHGSLARAADDVEVESESADDSEAKVVEYPSVFGDPPAGEPRKKYIGGHKRRATTTNEQDDATDDPTKPVYLTGRESCRTIMSHSQKQAPIYDDFMRFFNKCAPGCRPNKVYGMWGCRASGRSCHHTGQAVDIGGYKCGGRQVNMVASKRGGRIRTNPEFDSFVKCMIEKGGFRKLYKCKDHWDHAHFSRGCKQRKI